MIFISNEKKDQEKYKNKYSTDMRSDISGQHFPDVVWKCRASG